MAKTIMRPLKGQPVVGQEGPTALPDLFEMFPDLPRTLILKHDVLNWGISYTPALSEVGRWALPSGTFSYETHPDEIEAGRGKVSREEEAGNLYNIANFGVFRDGTNFSILLVEDSPYEIRYEIDGSYMLYWNGMAVEEVMFVPRPAWLTAKLKDGTPVPLILSPFGDTHT